MIAINSATKTWQEVDDLHYLRQLIGSRAYAGDINAQLQNTKTFGAWRLRALRENLLNLTPNQTTFAAQELSRQYDQTIAAAEATPGLEQARLLPLVLDKSLNDLTLARSIAMTPYTSFQGTVQQFLVETRCRNVRSANGQVVRQCRQVQVENPRYRQSQRDAKNFALSRRLREIDKSIERLELIRNQEAGLGEVERAQLDSRIAQLATESLEIQRRSRRIRAF